MPTTRAIGLGRAALAVTVIAAIVATAADTLSRGPLNVFNFFGYFTIQSNVFLALTLLVTAAFDLRRARHPSRLDLVRALATTYIVIVGLVYALLLAPLGAAGGVPVPWANVVLHVVTPILAAIDWLIVADRRALPWRRLPTVLAYPLVWLTVVLIRGASDGWVPYPFLDPANGYGAVAVVCLGICIAMIAVGALVFWVSRARVLVPHGAALEAA